jgi:hypothetical protein
VARHVLEEKVLLAEDTVALVADELAVLVGQY